MKRKERIVESATVTIDSGDSRRAVSASANAAKIMTAALEFTQQTERGKLKGAADECIDALAALAFGQIRREQGR